MAKEKKERFWLIKKEAISYLKISQRTIENYVNQGILRSYILGGRVYFDKYEIDEDIIRFRGGPRV